MSPTWKMKYNNISETDSRLAYSIVHKNLPMMTRSFRSKGRMSMSESMVGLTLAEITNIQKAFCHDVIVLCCAFFLYFKYTLEYIETFEAMAYHHIEALKTEFARLKSAESNLTKP